MARATIFAARIFDPTLSLKLIGLVLKGSAPFDL